MHRQTQQAKRASSLVGGATTLAKLVGCSAAFVYQWISGIRPVPAAYCIAIERATGGQVTRADLRPHDCGQIWPEYEPPGAADQGGAQQASSASAPPAPAQNGRARRRGAKQALGNR